MASSIYLQQLIQHMHLCSCDFVDFLTLLNRFLMHNVISQYGTKATGIRFFTPLWHLVKIWGQLDIKYATFFLLYLWETTNSFIGNWIEVVILVIMSQYPFLVLLFCTPLLFMRKKYYYFLFILSFWLAVMGHHKCLLILHEL